jgi:hypothetical protein
LVLVTQPPACITIHRLTRYKIKAYVTESRVQFAMIADLTIRGKDRLRTMGVAFARTPYAEGKND